MPRAVAIAGAAATSRFGATWRGLAGALATGAALRGVPPETPLAHPKARNARKMMSRGAYLAAATLGDLMRELAWTPEEREGAGYFLGVGASGGSLDDVTALLAASIVDGQFSPTAFGEAGLAACNPLLAFQLMNNFTLAHGAIFEGLGGPNGAVFSRGSGTTAALVEAVHAIACGDCDRAIAGGADSAIHPVTRAELAREGWSDLDVAEGAALLALVAVEPAVEPAAPPRAIVRGCALASGEGRPLRAAIDEAVARTLGTAGVEAVVIAGGAPAATEAAHAWTRERHPAATIFDTSALGATLAAGPALGWIAALDLLHAELHRVLILDAGVDGDAGTVLLEAPR